MFSAVKKLFCFSLAANLFLTGCSSSGTKKDTGLSQFDSSTPATAETSISADAEIDPESFEKLTMFSDVDFWDLPEWDFTKGSTSEGISEKTGAYLDITIPPQDASTKLSQMILQDNLDDIIVSADKNAIAQLIQSGQVWSLQELLETYCPDSHLLTEFPQDIKDELIREYGGWYAYPSHMNSEDARRIWKEKTSYYGDLYKHSHNNGILWNKKLLEEAGLTVCDVQTASGALAAYEKVKNLKSDDGESVIPLLLDGNNYIYFSIPCLIGSFGVEVVDDDGNYIEQWLQPECKDAFSFLNTAFRNGYAFSEDLTIDNRQLRTRMASGRIFCFVGNTGNTDFDPTEWVSAGPIISDSGKRPIMDITLSAPLGWTQTFVSKNCKNPKLAARFLDYMTSDEGLFYIEFGVEGEDCYFDKDGYVHLTEQGEKRDADPDDFLGKFWNFNNYAWKHSLIPVPEKGSSEYLKNQVQSAFACYPDTYVYDSALLRLPDNYITADSEEGKINTALDEFRKEQIPKILSASSDVEFEEAYQIFVDHQKELGAAKLDEKINKQMHENYSYYRKTIEKVNKHTENP